MTLIVIPPYQMYSRLYELYLLKEANQAIQAYELALKTNQKDVKLIRKLGTALTKTHYFSKAINYYKEAVSIQIFFISRFHSVH